RILGFYETVFFVTYILGTLMVKLNVTPKELFVYSILFTTISIIPISLTKILPPEVPPSQQISIPKIKNIVPLAIVGSFVAGFLVNGFINMGFVFILNEGFDRVQAS